jgi:hypothetical protein
MGTVRMKLQAEVSSAPHLEGDRITVAVTVRDEESGRAWSVESDLSDGVTAAPSQDAMPFEVAKRAEDALFTYLARREVVAQLRFLREKVVPHALGTNYRPQVGLRNAGGKTEYFLKS